MIILEIEMKELGRSPWKFSQQKTVDLKYVKDILQSEEASRQKRINISLVPDELPIFKMRNFSVVNKERYKFYKINRLGILKSQRLFLMIC